MSKNSCPRDSQIDRRLRYEIIDRNSPHRMHDMLPENEHVVMTSISSGTRVFDFRAVELLLKLYSTAI